MIIAIRFSFLGCSSYTLELSYQITSHISDARLAYFADRQNLKESL